jgi:Fe-S cluster biogenesis protein NfuA
MSLPRPDRTLSAALERIDRLLQQVAQLPDDGTRTAVEEIVRTLLEVHGDALRRTLRCIEQDAAGAGIGAALAGDPVVSSVLLVHDLHPYSLAQRVELALAQVQPYLLAHHGQVELLAVRPDQVVRLRLAGNCHSCPSSRATLKGLIEEALATLAPDIAALEVEGLVDEAPAPPAGASTTPLTIAGRPLCGVGPPPDAITQEFTDGNEAIAARRSAGADSRAAHE